MSDSAMQALRNAAASSAMEGMPLEQEHLSTIIGILEGKTTLQDYLRTLKEKQQEA